MRIEKLDNQNNSLTKHNLKLPKTQVEQKIILKKNKRKQKIF
jgi:hypothetical protein